MLFKTSSKYQLLLEKELEQQLLLLRSRLSETEEYTAILGNVERLHELLGEHKPTRISPETRATIAANLIGILMIIRHEDVNVISSKALGFVLRPR
jgi:hypothetical protein